MGFLAVALGAFGAHALADRLVEMGRQETWQTAVQYHFVHVLFMFGILILLQQFDSNHTAMQWLIRGYWSSLIGIIIFSGSLYILSLTGIKWLGAITPIGGLFFLLSWAFIAIFGWKFF